MHNPVYVKLYINWAGKTSAPVARLFAGTHDTPQNAAMIYSLFATCIRHQVNPHEWLLDVATFDWRQK